VTVPEQLSTASSEKETEIQSDIIELAYETVADKDGRQYNRRLVSVRDEHSPVQADLLRAIGDTWDDEIKRNPDWKGPYQKTDENGRPVAYEDGESKVEFDHNNEASEWLYFDDPGQKSMSEWIGLFPTAKALYPLQRLEDGGRVLPSGVLDERAKYLFTNMVDGIGLRARARIMKEWLVTVAENAEGDELTGISIGSGAAVPDIDATVAVVDRLGKSVNWHLVDPDTEALAFAQELAIEAGLPEETLNIHNKPYARAYGLFEEKVDFVDVLGLWEYLNDRQTASLLKDSLKLIKPGGSFIASNMLADRPQGAFNEKAVGWPSLVKRLEEDMVGIAVKAGVDTSTITFTYSEDHVYLVMEVKKP